MKIRPNMAKPFETSKRKQTEIQSSDGSAQVQGLLSNFVLVTWALFAGEAGIVVYTAMAISEQMEMSGMSEQATPENTVART